MRNVTTPTVKRPVANFKLNTTTISNQQLPVVAMDAWLSSPCGRVAKRHPITKGDGALHATVRCQMETALSDETLVKFLYSG